MPHYKFCNFIVASKIVFLDLAPSTTNKLDIIQEIEVDQQQTEKSAWLHHWLTPSGEISISFCKEGDSHRLRFPALADFLISPSADRITAYPAPGTPIETTRHLLLDQVLPRCLAHQGQIMLHASAVALPQGVVLFIGSTGQGKSTLAGYFHTQGEKALSDDCVRLVESPAGVQVIPSYGGLRLWPDALETLFPQSQPTAPMAHYSSKQRLQLPVPEGALAPEAAPTGYPLLAVIVLTPGSESQAVRLEALPRRQAFIELMKQTFLLDVSDRGRYRQLMQAVGSIIPRLRVFSLSLPHDYTLLPQARRAILEAL